MSNEQRAPKKLVTSYCVKFYGLFGRNRSIKRHYGRNVVGPTIPDDFDLGRIGAPVFDSSTLPAEVLEFVKKLVAEEAPSVKPKQGSWIVSAYRNTEVSTYHCAIEGREVNTLVIPITQGFDVYHDSVHPDTTVNVFKR